MFREPSPYAAGVRAGVPFGFAALLTGLSFGVVAKPVMGAGAAIAMSAFVFAGAAQFGSVAVLASGGGALTAILAGIMLNARFLPMGVAIAGSLRGGPFARALQGQTVVDASWAAAHLGGGRFDRHLLMGATIPQYPAWVLGTAIGALGADKLGDPKALGLDRGLPRVLPGPAPRRGRGVPHRPSDGADGSGNRPRAHAAAAARPADPARRHRVAARPEADHMSDAWIVIIALTVATVAIKAAGPAAVGGREMPPRVTRVISLFAPALLAALIVVETFGGTGRSLTLDARAAGLAAAGAILVTTESLIGAVVGAAATTALLRLVA